MNCKQARGKLALLIGNDLDGSAMQDVQKHLGECSGCRGHLKQLSSCLEVLQVPVAANFGTGGESLWPNLSSRLASPSAGQKPHRLNGWASTLAVAAACTVMFWVASRQFMPNDSPLPGPSKPIPFQPVDQRMTPRNQIRPARPSDVDEDSARPSNEQSGIMGPREGGSNAIPVTPVKQAR
jgi:hypothetical protein